MESLSGNATETHRLKQPLEAVFESSSSDSRRKALARRSQLEVRMDMLKAVKAGAEKPTQIMYKANLSWVALQTHLTTLLEKGLLLWAAEGTRKRYELTLKGSNVMYSYDKILEEVGRDDDSFLAAR